MLMLSIKILRNSGKQKIIFEQIRHFIGGFCYLIIKRTTRRIRHVILFIVQLFVADCKNTGDIQNKLKRLFAGTIEQMLEAKMEEHLRRR